MANNTSNAVIKTARTETTQTKERRGEQRLEVYIGTMNVNGILPGSRLQWEIYENRRRTAKNTAGRSVDRSDGDDKNTGSKLDDANGHTSKPEGMEEEGKYLQQEGLGGGGHCS
eukprot:6214251-Pleurochrysis_carterae.AAC.1